MYPGAVYRINVDTDGDAHADVAFTFTFSEYQGGRQTGTAWYHRRAARQPEPAGEVLAEAVPVSFDGMAPPVQAGRIRLLAGRRSDPFFADVEGTLHGFAWTGHDNFAGHNVTSLVLRSPPTCSSRARRSESGPRSAAAAATAPWSRWTAAGTRPSTRSSTPTGKGPVQLPAARRRRGQLPGAVVQDPGKRRLPARGGQAAALQVLPDILRYDRTKPPFYPNGRRPIEDIYSYRFAWLTYGKVPPQGLKPHPDLLTDFPYLGPPNP